MSKIIFIHAEICLYDLRSGCLQTKERPMKKLLLSLVLGGTTIAMATDDAAFDDVVVAMQSSKPNITHHEFQPVVHYLNHKEGSYNYNKVLGGLGYNYLQPEGLNFNSYFGYSMHKDQSYTAIEWAIKYHFQYGDALSLYPSVGANSSSHYLSHSDGATSQIYRSSILGGMGCLYNWNDFMTFDTVLSYFKDLSTVSMIKKGNEYYGKGYTSPDGLRAHLNVRFLTALKQNIEVGGYYAQTFKDFYKEFGFKTSIIFAF